MGLKKIGVSMVADGAAGFYKSLSDGDSAVTKFGQSATSTAPKINAFSEIATGALRRVGAAAVDLAAQGIKALGNLAVDAVKVSGDFEAGMNQFQIAVGKTLDGTGLSLDDFRKQFIQIGKDLPVSTSDVEQAAIQMSRGGIDPATIAADGLRRTIQFAAASLKGDLTQAADISAKTMQAWTNITDDTATKTTFLAHAQDLMTQATTAASTTVDQLFQGLSNVGGTARLAGVSFDETITALAQLTPSFASSADAGTSYKVFLQSLLPTGKAQIAQMKELNLYTDATGSAFYDAQGKFVGMGKAEELLHSATKDLTDAQREQALKTIFGSDAIRAAAVFSTQGIAGYDGLAKSISQQSNVAEAAAITQRGLNTAWENAKGSVEAFEITVGSRVIPTLTDFLNNTIAPGINWLTNFADVLLSSQHPFATFTAVVDSAVPGFASFVSAAQSFGSFVRDNLGPILAGLGATLAYVFGPTIIAGVSTVLTVVSTFAAPLIAVGVAAAALYVAWQTNFLGIQTTLTSVWNTIQPIFTSFGTVIGSVVTLGSNVAAAFGEGGVGAAFATLSAGLPAVTTAFSNWATNAGTILLGLGQQFVAWIAPLVPQALTALGSFAAQIGAWIVQQAPTWAAQLVTWGEVFVTWVTPYAGQALTALGSFAADVGAWIVQQAPQWAAQLLSWGEQFVNWVSPYAAKAIGKLDEFASTAWQWVTAQAPVLLAKLESWGESLVNWVQPKIQPLLTQAGTLATAFVGWIGEQAAPILAKLGTWASSLVAWIVPATTDFLAKWPGVLSRFLDWIGTAAGPLLLKLGDWALQFTAWILPMIPGFIVALAGIAGALIVFVGETAVTLLAKLQEWGENLGKWIKLYAIPALGPAWQSFKDNLSGLLSAGARWLSDESVKLGDSLVAGIKSGVSSAWSSFTGWIHDKVMEIPAAVRAALGIHSPSQVMADDVGVPIMEGIALGMQKGLPLLQSNLQRVNTSLGATAQYTRVAGGAAGTQFVAGMNLGILNGMPDLVAAMRKSTDSTIQEILGFFDQGDLTAGMNQVGADALNAFVAGMNQTVPQLGATLGDVHQALQLIFTPPDTTSLTSALATVKGTVLDLGTLLHGNNTIEGDTKQSWGSIVDLTHQAWEQVRLGISNAVIDARTTVDTATKAILQVTTDSFTRLRATSDMAWGQIHLGIKDQITQTQANVKLSTDEMMRGTSSTFALMQADSTRIWGQIHLNIQDQITRTQAGVNLTTSDMQKATTATWGRIGADATSGWQKVKGNIETQVAGAKETVATASTAMQTSMVIPPTMQDQIFESYRHVTDTMIAQLERVTKQIQNVIDAWTTLIHLPNPSAPSGTPPGGVPAGYNPGQSAPPGGSRALGGPVWAGLPTLVGERGRELFVPQTNGYVLPSSVTQRISPPASPQQIMSRAMSSTVINYGPTISVTGQYRYESEQTLTQKVQMLATLYGST